MNTITNKPQPSANDDLKVVIVGNVGAGKTTAISTVSEVPVIHSEAKATEQEILLNKTHTTVAVEYGSVHIDQTKVHLYGTPGQRRFHFMADIASKGASGMIIMIDNGYNQPLAEIDYFLQYHWQYLQSHPALIAITHYENNCKGTHLIEYHSHIRKHGLPCPVMCVDARQEPQVRRVIEKLYHDIMRERFRLSA